MKKFAALLVAGALCSSCFAFAGCAESDEEAVDPDVVMDEAIADLDPVGEYHFDSLSLDANGELTASGLGAEWDGVVLDEGYAVLVVNEDGTLAVSGAVNFTGTWDFASGYFSVALDGAECCGQGVDSEGNLNIDVMTDDGILSYYFCK